jgi:hypothetical protein
VVAVPEIDVLLQNGLVRVLGGPVAGCGAGGCLERGSEVCARFAGVGEGCVLGVREGLALRGHGDGGDGVCNGRGAVWKCGRGHVCGPRRWE